MAGRTEDAEVASWTCHAYQSFLYLSPLSSNTLTSEADLVRFPVDELLHSFHVAEQKIDLSLP
jgi:hypothetical protein